MSSEIVVGCPQPICSPLQVACDFSGEYDGHDDAVNCYDFAEDDPVATSEFEWGMRAGEVECERGWKEHSSAFERAQVGMVYQIDDPEEAYPEETARVR